MFAKVSSLAQEKAFLVRTVGCNMNSVTTIVLAALCFAPVAALDNGLARTPPMGFSTWSVFRKDVSDGLVRELADALVSTGLASAGYDYLLVDDGWFAKGCESCMPARNETGHLNADPQKFPSGLGATADYVHAKGLRFGLWFGHSMCSVQTNDTATGSALSTEEADPDYATLDAQFFAANGVDSIKHDNCVDVANTSDAIGQNYERFARLSRAINATGRPMMFDVVLQVAHGRSVPSYDEGYVWSPEVYGQEAVTSIANMWWSLPVNKYNCWSCCVNGENIVDDTHCTSATGHACRRGLLPMLDIQDLGVAGFSLKGHWDWGGPGGWNHLDQLAVCTGESWYGPGFTPTEQRAQLSLWAVLASPLIISFDVRNVSADCLSLVTNARALAVHQDAAGRPGRRVRNIFGASEPAVEAQVWGRPLANGGVAVVFFNRGEATRIMTATFAELGLPPTVAKVTVADVWSGTVTQGVASPIMAHAVEAHGVTFVTLTPEIEALV